MKRIHSLSACAALPQDWRQQGCGRSTRTDEINQATTPRPGVKLVEDPDLSRWNPRRRSVCTIARTGLLLLHEHSTGIIFIQELSCVCTARLLATIHIILIFLSCHASSIAWAESSSSAAELRSLHSGRRHISFLTELKSTRQFEHQGDSSARRRSARHFVSRRRLARRRILAVLPEARKALYR